MRLTPWVTRLIVANFLVFVLVPGNSPLYMLMTLFPPAVVGMDNVWLVQMPFRPWTAFTYMFLHAGIGHLLFNMLGLFFFGGRLETKLGAPRFLMLYFLSGVGAAAFSFLFSWQSPVVGASGAVYGILAGYAMFCERGDRAVGVGVEVEELKTGEDLAIAGSVVHHPRAHQELRSTIRGLLRQPTRSQHVDPAIDHVRAVLGDIVSLETAVVVSDIPGNAVVVTRECYECYEGLLRRRASEP